jgi:hypothetical protein
MPERPFVSEAPSTVRPFEYFLRDPLGDTARKERRSLLVTALVTIVLGGGGRAVPTKLSVAGLDIALSDNRTLMAFLAVVLVYFTIAFAIYAWSDYSLWYYGLRQAKSAFKPDMVEVEHVDRPSRKTRLHRIPLDDRDAWVIQQNRAAQYAFQLRASIDSLVPLMLAVFALGVATRAIVSPAPPPALDAYPIWTAPHVVPSLLP